VFCLSRTGTTNTSHEFAERVRQWREDSRDVTLVIGGAFGLDPDLIASGEGTLSLSAMTLPHELARAILLEQLYRADTILHGEPYHKGGK
jgi:23S rRNA (pseudouridine1915-N3)-methyltransferase